MNHAQAIKVIKEAFSNVEVKITHSKKGNWINFARLSDGVHCEFHMEDEFICGSYEINGKNDGINLFMTDRTDVELLVHTVRVILELGRPSATPKKEYPPLRLILGGKAA